MSKQLGSQIGNNLVITIPSRGETNWDVLIETLCFQKISDHDHTGNGKGTKISTAALEDSSITTVKIADDAVTGDKIADNSITSAHIAPDVILDVDVAPDSIGTSELKIDAVETENIKDASVTTSKIADANITTAKIADFNVTTDKIADASISTAKLNNDSITKAKINADVAGQGLIQDTDGSLKVNTGVSLTVSADKVEIATMGVKSNHIGNNAVVEGHIDTYAVTTNKIANDAVTTDKILDANVTTAKIADSNVTTTKIADSNITTAKLANGAVTNSKLGTDIPLSKLSDVSSTVPTDGQLLQYSISSGEWFPASLGGATGVIDYINQQSDATNYTGTARFIIINNTLDLTFTADLSDRVILNAYESSQTITFKGDMKRCIIKTGNLGNTFGPTLVFTNPTSSNMTIYQCNIDAREVRFEDTNSSSSGLFDRGNNINAGIVKYISNYRDLNLNTSKINCNTLEFSTTGNYTLKFLEGSTADADTITGRYTVTNGKLYAANGSTGTTYITGNAGYYFLNTTSTYAQSMTVTPKGINTNVCVLAQGGSYTVPASSSAQTLILSVELIDNTDSYDTSTYTFTAKVAGYYDIKAALRANIASGDYIEFFLYKNTSRLTWEKLINQSTSTERMTTTSATTQLLNVGDTIYITIKSNAGNSFEVGQLFYSLPNRLIITKING